MNRPTFLARIEPRARILTFPRTLAALALDSLAAVVLGSGIAFILIEFIDRTTQR